MAPYYFNVDGYGPYTYGVFCEEMGSLLLRDHGARQSVPWIISECETDPVARNREIARPSFSSSTRSCLLCPASSAKARSLAGPMQ
jgi:hypothetical protein